MVQVTDGRVVLITENQVVQVAVLHLQVTHQVEQQLNQLNQAIVVLTVSDTQAEIVTQLIVAQEAEAQVQPVLQTEVEESVVQVKHIQFQVHP